MITQNATAASVMENQKKDTMKKGYWIALVSQVAAEVQSLNRN